MTGFFSGVYYLHVGLFIGLTIILSIFEWSIYQSKLADALYPIQDNNDINGENKRETPDKEVIESLFAKRAKIYLVLLALTIFLILSVLSYHHTDFNFIDSLFNFKTLMLITFFLICYIKLYSSLLLKKEKEAVNESNVFKNFVNRAFCFVSGYIIIASIIVHANSIFDFSKPEEITTAVLSSYQYYSGMKNPTLEYALNIEQPICNLYVLNVSPELQNKAKNGDKITAFVKKGLFGSKYISKITLIKASKEDSEDSKTEKKQE